MKDEWAWILHVLRREAEGLILPDLPAFLEGTYQPRSNDERFALLGACWFADRTAAAHGPDASGRITILVSHRFSTVRMADLIVVLDGARLVELGTHEELIAKRGQYAELFGIQAAAYR